MDRSPCFLYQENEHFSLPPALRAAKRNVCMFALKDGEGRVLAAPHIFREVRRPEDAEFFLFPWDIGQYIDGGLQDDISAVIAGLPYLAGREKRHVVCDDGDFTTAFSPPILRFKISVTRNIASACIPMPYALPSHMFGKTPDFNRDGIRFDTSFVGNLTNLVRKAVTASVRRQAPELRFLLDYDDSFVVANGYYYNTREGKDPAKTSARQQLYRRSLNESLTVLCPPGVGPHSIRLYETMYMGRIPVIFGDEAVYPLENLIAYDAFCLHIPGDALMDTGSILNVWLHNQSEDALMKRCVRACRTWNTYFAPQKLLGFMLEAAREKAGKLADL